MSKSLKDAECLHTNQHDANVISPVVNSSDEAWQKIIKLEITHMMNQQRGYQKPKDFLNKKARDGTRQGKGKYILLHQARR